MTSIGLVLIGSLLIGGVISLIIGISYDAFVWISPTITILDSLFLGIGVLISLYFTRYLAPRTQQILPILLLSFALILGVGVIAFVFFVASSPTAFIYSDNRSITYLLINLLFFISFNIIISGFVVFQQRMLEKEKALHEETVLKSRMELQLLSSKVNPHFLFNSLNLMVSLLKTPALAEKALLNLAEILRFQLDCSELQSVSLEDELNIVEKYLSLQQMRFGEKLKYQISCRTEGRIPPMIIQPLVENSIKHNIDNTSQLTVSIDAGRENDHLLITVSDSQAKLTPDMIESGIGLTVTAKRVTHLGGSITIRNGGIEITCPI